MKNWSVDEKQFAQRDPQGYRRWRLEQLINYGLDGEKISRQELSEHWSQLDIDPARRKFLSLLLYGDTNKQPPKPKAYRRFFQNVVRQLTACFNRLA